MQAEFLAENVIDYLSPLGKMVPMHSQIPILSSILLETDSSGLTLSATDLEFGIRINVLAKIEKEGGVLIPGKQFVELVSSLNKGKIKISQEKDQLILLTESGSFKFQVLPKDEFPKLFEEKGDRVGEFDSYTFADIFTKLVFAVSQDDSRPHLTGVYVVKKEDRIDYVATDGFRMSLKRVVGDTKLSITEGLILPQRLILEGLSLKTADKVELFVYGKGNQAIVNVGQAMLVGRLIEGNYPDYERVLPKDSKTSIVVDREELLQLLKTVSIFARESANVIGFEISKGALLLTVSSTSLGEAESKIEGKQEGEDNNISFNIRFVMDFLRNVQGKTVKISVNSPVEPALFTTDDDKGFMHVIMPVKVQE